MIPQHPPANHICIHQDLYEKNNQFPLAPDRPAGFRPETGI